MPTLPGFHTVQIQVLPQPPSMHMKSHDTIKTSHLDRRYRGENGPTLPVVLFILLALILIAISFAIATVIVRSQRRREARKEAYDAEVPPPYDDGLPRYSDVPKDDDVLEERLRDTEAD